MSFLIACACIVFGVYVVGTAPGDPLLERLALICGAVLILCGTVAVVTLLPLPPG